MGETKIFLPCLPSSLLETLPGRGHFRAATLFASSAGTFLRSAPM
jgi:hypothetical protein